VGFLVPTKTPREIITQLNKEIVRAVELQDVKDRILALGFESATYRPEEVAVLIRTGIPKWASVIRGAGIKAE